MEKGVMQMDELSNILDDQIRAMANEEIKLDNKLFTRQCQKTNALANIAGKKIGIVAQQLYANEMGAQIAVPALGIEEGQIMLEAKHRAAKLLQ